MSAGNPYDPSAVPPGGLGPGSGVAASKVSGPAIALIVVGVINILAALYSIASGAVTMAMDPEEMQRQMEAQNPNMQNAPGLNPQAFGQIMQIGGTAYIVIGVIALIAAVVIIMAGLKMKNLQSRGLAMTGSILAMIPCISGCCLVGLPVGIWAIITLNDPDVRSSFLS